MLLLTAALQAQQAPKTEGGKNAAFLPPRQRPPHEAVLKKFDKDGDGKLSPEERKEMHAARKIEFEKQFDKDGDGKLSKDERQAMREAHKAEVEKRKAEYEKRFQAQFDKDGDGKLNAEETKALEAERAKRAERMREMAKLRRNNFDKNGDGKLDAAEEKAWMEAREQFQKKYGDPAVQHRAEMLKKFDKNGDGKLDEEERKAMQAERKGKFGPGGRGGKGRAFGRKNLGGAVEPGLRGVSECYSHSMVAGGLEVMS